MKESDMKCDSENCFDYDFDNKFDYYFDKSEESVIVEQSY